MKYFILFYLLIESAMSSVGQTATPRSYHCKEIGWTIWVPDGWAVLSKKAQAGAEARGQKSIEKATGEEVQLQGLKSLISFRRDPLNIFSSSIEPFREEKPGEYEESNRKVYELIYNTFKSEGIKADTSSGQEIIRGNKFYTFKTIIYSRDGEVILQQKMFSRLVKGYDFDITISYSNEEDKQTMLDAWMNSKEL